ncbi:MAG: hypothetical protein IPP72_16520 [Chitinophagaceae bacterium]|nr:hypothetical protein [Chitinophagaceae bacterium]
MAFGPGIASDHMLFTKTNVGIKDLTPAIRFTNAADTNHFKKQTGHSIRGSTN